MQLKPNPTELATPINPEGSRKMSVESHRNLFCPQYDDCLDEAVRRGWNSWTCARCPLYKIGGQLDSGLHFYATQRKSA
jgi:hypothetical protein